MAIRTSFFKDRDYALEILWADLNIIIDEMDDVAGGLAQAQVALQGQTARGADDAQIAKIVASRESVHNFRRQVVDAGVDNDYLLRPSDLAGDGSETAFEVVGAIDGTDHQ